MKKEFNHASESFKRLNPHLFVGQLREPKRQPAERGKSPDCQLAESQGSLGWRVRITSFRSKLLDGDNLQTGLKPLRDAIASTLASDDNERFIAWEYHQCLTLDVRGTLVEIGRGHVLIE